MLGLSLNIINLSLYDSINHYVALTNRYEDRVEADGGVVEALNCVNNADFIGAYNWTYYFRVIDDGGVVESLECVTL